MGPSRKKRDDAADLRRQENARNRLTAEQFAARADEAERQAEDEATNEGGER